MRKEYKLILIIFLMFLFSYKITYSEEKKFNYDHLKKLFIEKNYYFIHLKSLKNISMKHLWNYLKLL